MVDLGNINMIVKYQGQVIKIPTLGPCDGYVNSSWLSLNVKKNPKSSTHFGVKIYCFDGKLSEGVGCSAIAFKPRLLGLTLSLVVRLDELVFTLKLKVLGLTLSLFW